MRRSRFNQLGAVVALASAAALGMTACTGSRPAAPNKPRPTASSSAPTQSEALSRPYAAQEQAELAQINKDSLLAARQILAHLAEPAVGASAYVGPKDLTTVGNLGRRAFASGKASGPETWLNYDPKDHLVFLTSLSRTDVDKSGASIKSLGFQFAIKDGSALSTKNGRHLTVQSYQRALSDPANVTVVQAGGTWGENSGYAISNRGGTLSMFTGFGAESGGIAASDSTEINLLDAKIESSAQASLAHAANELGNTFKTVVPVLNREFIR